MPIVSLLLLTTAQAETYNVNTTVDLLNIDPENGCIASTTEPILCSLRAAIEASVAQGGGPHDIIVPSGTYPIGSEMLLDGQTHARIHGFGPGQTIIDGGGVTRILRVYDSTLELYDATMQNGNAGSAEGDDGGALHVEESVATLSNVTFSGNMAHRGGGLYARISQLDISDSDFIGNSALDDGGGALVSASSGELDYLILRSTFTGNTAARYGGGLYSAISGGLVQEVLFEDNSAEEGGGACSVGRAAQYQEVIFRGNQAALGGGLNSEDADVRVDDSTFIDNHAAEGGAIAVSFPHPNGFHIEDSVLSGNSAERGGGLWFSGGLLLEESTVSHNSAGQDGGGIYASAVWGLDLYIERSSVHDNNTGPEGMGGGLFAGTGDRNEDSEFIGNVLVTDSTIAYNKAAGGGGIALEVVAPLNHALGMSLLNVTLAENEGTIAAGGLMNQDASVYVTSSVLADNTDAMGFPECAGDVAYMSYTNLFDPAGCNVLASTDLDTGVSGLLSWIDPGAPGGAHFSTVPDGDTVDNGASGPCSDEDQIHNARVGACDRGAIENIYSGGGFGEE